MLCPVLIHSSRVHAHPVIKIGCLSILGCGHIVGNDFPDAIKTHQVEHRFDKGILNALAQNAATEQEGVNLVTRKTVPVIPLSPNRSRTLMQ